jgi:hypothetical protein
MGPSEPQERGLGQIGVPDQQRRLGLARRKREIEGTWLDSISRGTFRGDQGTRRNPGRSGHQTEGRGRASRGERAWYPGVRPTGEALLPLPLVSPRTAKLRSKLCDVVVIKLPIGASRGGEAVTRRTRPKILVGFGVHMGRRDDGRTQVYYVVELLAGLK